MIIRFVNIVISGTLLLCNIGCAKQETENKSMDMNIKLTWTVITNMVGGESSCRAAFTIQNNANQTLGNSGWAIYYSQSPRDITNAPDAKATIKHISGDWFTIIPTQSFSLAPKEQVTVHYDLSHYLIKETDAPLYPYIVHYDNNGNETSFSRITDYKILPFVKPEQINRGPDDVVTIPSSESRYQENEKLSLLPEDVSHKIIPTPVSITSPAGTLELSATLQIHYSADLLSEAKYLQQMLQVITGTKFTMLEKDYTEGRAIILQTEPMSVNGITTESYVLDISSTSGVSITGSDPAGVFYGIQSLMALMPVDFYIMSQRKILVPTVRVEDAPRFPYRGQHLDVCRNFFSKKAVLKLMDIMAFYKLNTLQLYLSEDEGWRIEIEALPELTAVGGQRQHTSKAAATLHPSYGSGPIAYEKGTYGSGFYTREDFIEMLQYAKERHITLIPTINFPGHSRAAIKAMEARYQRFMAKGKEKLANEYRLIDPLENSQYSSAQGYTDNVVNVARESVYHFYETVIKSISDMYLEADVPFIFFHTGGDEVPHGSWSNSPLINELLETMPKVKNPMNLQAHFFRRATDILEKYDIKIGGWEEVVLLRDAQGIPVPNPEFVGKNVVPYFWVNAWGQEDLAYRLANIGYEVVMCNVTDFYFDLAYDKDPEEPGLYWGGFNKTRDAYETAPLDLFKTTTTTPSGAPIDIEKTFKDRERLLPENKNNIIGVQGQLWSETIKGDQMLEYYYLPKIIGFAETAWSDRDWETIADRDEREKAMVMAWNVFTNILARKDLPRLNSIFGGYHYRIPLPGAVVENGILKANVEFPGLDLRYTTDGSDPTLESSLFTGPVEVSGTVKIRAFDAAGKGSRTSAIEAK
ncbi:MAG: family 20 glycosylhydrolase [Candidatus Neomarinimicrobiota bacterium]